MPLARRAAPVSSVQKILPHEFGKGLEIGFAKSIREAVLGGISRFMVSPGNRPMGPGFALDRRALKSYFCGLVYRDFRIECGGERFGWLDLS